MMCPLQTVLLISLLQILPSACQPLDLPERKSCDFEDLRQGAIRQVRLAGEKLRDLQTLYDKTVKTNINLQTQNSKLLEGFKNVSNGNHLFDLYMNTLNESVLQEVLNEMESQTDVLDLQVKTLESEKDKLNDVRNFLIEASNNKGFFHVSDDHMFFVPWLKKNWSESQNFCRLLKGSLAKLLDEKMNTNMRNRVRRLNPKEDYWIGGIRQENEWIWAGNNSTREPIRWFDWAPGEPNQNSTGGNCMHMWKERDFQWDNDFCRYQKRFICAKPLF